MATIRTKSAPEREISSVSIPSLARKDSARERDRATASLRRAKEIKQFLMSLFLSRSRVLNGTLPGDIKVAISLL